MNGILHLFKSIGLETALCFYLAFVLGTSLGMIGPSLVVLAHQTDRELVDMGLLLLLMPLAFLAGVYLCRFFINHPKLQWLVVAAVILYGLALSLIIITSSFFLLIALFLLLVLAEGALDLFYHLMLLRRYKENTAPYMNAMYLFSGLGTILSPLLIGLNIQYFNQIGHSYIFLALLGVPALIMLFFVRIKPIVDEVAPTPKRNKNFRILFFFHLFFFFYLVMEAGYGTWIYPYMEQGGILDAAAAGFFTSCFWFAFMLFRLTGIFLSIRFRPIKVMLVHSIICVAAVAILLVGREQLFLLWLGNIALGGALAIFLPCMIAYVGTGFNVPLKDISHFYTSGAAGDMIGPWLLAHIFAFQPFWIFYPLLISALVLLAILIYLERTRIYPELKEPITDSRIS